jgi:1-acyl-sn-glycerol-3-phosphate acyltransferase
MTAEKQGQIDTENRPLPDNLLDIEKVIETKNPLLRKLLPGFFIAYLKRLLHQDEMNGYLIRHRDQMGVDFIDAVLEDMNTRLELIGIENIPEKQRCIIASNHPLGGLDGMALMLAVSKVRNDIIFPVNDILLNIKNLKPLFIPINKHGSNAENIKIINDTFAEENVICYFPFGLVSRKKKGEIKDLEWKTTFITKARRFKRDIIPTHISGRNTNFFYNLANLRKKAHIKANIEMLFLVDELTKQKNKTLVFTFGKPVPYNYFDKRYPIAGWAEMMRRYIYKMSDGFDTSFTDWIEQDNPSLDT